MHVNVLVEGLPVVAADCGGKDCEIEWTGLGRSVHFSTQSEIGLVPTGEGSL